MNKKNENAYAKTTTNAKIDKNIQKVADKLKDINANIHKKLTPKSVRIAELQRLLALSDAIEPILLSQLELYKTNDKSCLNLTGKEQKEAAQFIVYVAGVMNDRIQSQSVLSNESAAGLLRYITALWSIAITEALPPCNTSIDVLAEMLTMNEMARKQHRKEFDSLTNRHTFGHKNNTNKVEV